MKKVILGLTTLIMFNGCSYATLQLVYSDAKIVYQDARYVVHEIQQAKEAQKSGK